MIFEHPFFSQMLLPFLLVFVVVFAILQKSNILGEGKAQIDAMVSFVIGLILITFSYQTGVIVQLMSWLAVGVAVILVFLILYGFVGGDLKEGKPWMKVVFGILAGLFTIGIVVYITGFWDVVTEWFSGAGNSSLWMNILFLVLVVGAIVVAVVTGKSGGSGRTARKTSD
jgi:hypothetical protein